MHLAYKIIFSLWLCVVAVRSQVNEANWEIVEEDEQSIYATTPIYDSCGGYVEAKCDQTVVIEYKPDEEYDNDEFCVWEVRNGECYRALFTKTTSGFEVGHDYLQISGFIDTYNPPTHNYLMGNITGIEQVSADGHFNFVVFTTDYSNTGTGFRLEIVGYSERSFQRVYEDFVTVSPAGSLTLRPYYNSMTQSYLIVPRLKTGVDWSLVLDIEYLTRAAYDFISVYSMERNGQSINFRQHASRLTGNGTASFQTDYYANFIVLFYSDTSRDPQIEGYVLNWYVPYDGRTTESYV